MRLSNMFGRTLRDNPTDATLASHQLSVRAGLVRQLAAGIYSYLPLGWRVISRLMAIIREEMDGIGGQELAMPIVQPAGLWRQTGRYDAPDPGPALVRFQDRSAHDLVLAMTHEEAVTELARSELHSYRQLPLLVYQLQTKFRDEPRARGGLIRVREFLMKDAYSFHAEQDSLDACYNQVYAAYQRIMERCGIAAIPVEASAGMMGGGQSHEFMALNDGGEDTVMRCRQCGYTANVEAASIARGKASTDSLAPMARVATPGMTTIASLAEYLGVGARQTLKAVLYRTLQGEVIFAAIRGDLEINEAKLAAVLGDTTLEPATPMDLETHGLVAGYASPVGVTGVKIVADESILGATNLVAGANVPDYHLRNVNHPRDYQVSLTADIALARDGDPCPHCKSPLAAARAIEIGHIFKLGSKYGDTVGATFQDRDGVAKSLLMGCYGIGLGRLMACIIEQHHDEYGIIWPASVAPYQVHLVSLGGPKTDVGRAAEELYRRLVEGGYRVLLDDREETPGVKFNDADLIGVPVRLTVSRRTLAEQAVEIKPRWLSCRVMVPYAQLETHIDKALGGDAPSSAVLPC